MKTVLVAAAVLVAAVAVWVGLTLPPPRITLRAVDDHSVPGVVHVHSNRSDGSSGPDDIAAAAARAGLKFVVFTDHGDATRTPDPPTYRSGVLCLDGFEISTNEGHYVAFDMPASPYPLGGEARDVVEDVRRLGGFGVAAHPDSPKPQLRWTEWNAPVDGIELLNPDTSWRLLAQEPGWHGRGALVSALFHYPWRGAQTIDGLLQPSSVIPQWLAIASQRHIVAMAGVDAHARVDLLGDPGDGSPGRWVPLPSYDATFRSMALHVAVDRALSGSATADAAVLMRGIRAGHFFTALDGVAGPPAFEFTASNDLGTVREGDELGASGPVTLTVASNAPASYTTVVHQGREVITSVRDPQQLVVHASAAPAVYWVEIVAPGRRVPWLRSNPIYVRSAAPIAPGLARTPVTDTVPLPTDGWHTEHDATSTAETAMVGGARAERLLRFTLGPGAASRQYAALALDTPQGIAGYTRIGFTARADRPMRVSVQVRSDEAVPDRWQRSVYVDRFDHDRTVFLDDLTPVGSTRSDRPPLDRVRAILFVIDLTNTRPGTAGQMWIRIAALER
jgi:hypothetical protein